MAHAKSQRRKVEDWGLNFFASSRLCAIISTFLGWLLAAPNEIEWSVQGLYRGTAVVNSWRCSMLSSALESVRRGQQIKAEHQLNYETK